ncbi:MAG: efflux RND transporter permease subunit [Deltaproteobacteria bacterium]|nr:efflux RND transporter permease subunit [Deltaproteobacteria bacterium]
MIAWLIELSAKHRGLVLLFAVALAIGGVSAARRVKLDAIPDLSDPQVIVFTEWMGRSPTLVEDQVTYPLVSGLLGARHVVDVRAQTMFGMSFVYVVFEEGTDLYDARARVSELLSTLRARLPPDAVPRLGPDASGIGWVYQYALVDDSHSRDLGELRALHDTTVRYALASVPGVAEVATCGGFEPQWQVLVDPTRLRARGLTLADVVDAVRRSNREVGGRVLEASQREYFIRGRGILASPEELSRVVLRAGDGGTPVRVSDVARVQVGAELRRGAAELDGLGEVVSGVVVMRHGENARDVIRAVEARVRELHRALPQGVRVLPVYDRSALIDRAIDTLRGALTEEMIVVALVIILFLLHLRSALLPIVSLPLAVLAAFIPMWAFDIPATIMSLGGIAIAIGATVDAEIVMVEAAHKKLEHAPADLSEEARSRLLAEAAREVTPAIFFSLLIIAVSFLPVFGLNGQAGRLFRPLAFTKTFVMLSAAILSVTVAPALRDALLRGKVHPEARHPVSRAIRAVYEPFVHVALRNPATTVLLGVLALVSALPLVGRLGSEFMPPLDEGDLLYMPTTLPNVSIEEARRMLQRQDAILAQIPEVEHVLGKVGRAETPTDPAPLSMVETVVKLRPRARWGTRYVRRWYVGWTPTSWRPMLNRVWPEFRPKTREELVDEIDARMRFPGWTNAWTQPIRNRVDMLTTGIRTPLGIKVQGSDLAAIERVGTLLEGALHGVPGTRSVLFERQQGGAYLDITPDREALARHGLSAEVVLDAVETALGGGAVTTVIDGRRRYTVSVRYLEDQRSSVERIAAMLLPRGGDRGDVPLGSVATVRVTAGPPMVRDEGGLLTGYVYVDVDGTRDLGSYVADAKRVASSVLPAGSGVGLRWAGQYELLEAMEARMRVLIPLALGLVVLLLYLQFKNLTEVLIVLLSVPFALVGSVWALFLLGYHLSTAVWVGLIALVGLAAQTGVVMIVYIDNAYERRLREGKINSLEDIIEAHAEGTIQRVRPKLMTVGTMLVGLVPLLWAEGSGADVMKRIAAPMVGGLLTSAFLTLEIIPVIYTYWRNEQRVWRALEGSRPEALGALLGWTRAATLGAAGLLAALALWLYVPTLAAYARAAGAGALASVLTASAGYVLARRGLDPAAPEGAARSHPSEEP